uniref:Uncharacterized protein n=1 Tax=Meloidogyne incognita TaxID=6306 RepID=A0A914NVJ4_MELIC
MCVSVLSVRVSPCFVRPCFLSESVRLLSVCVRPCLSARVRPCILSVFCQTTQKCKPHCTSKLTGFESFDSLNTFGFRGEALNALTNTSQVQITTRDANSRCAFKLVFDRNGKILEKEQCSRQARKSSQLLSSPGGNTQLIDVITNLLGTPKNELLELSESIPEEDIQQIYKINNTNCESIFKQI